MKVFVIIFALIGIVLAGEDYYRLLGIPRNADEKAIKKAFKKMSLKYHPDKNLDNKEKAEQQFMKIANAYEVLSDPEKRKIYDAHGEEGLKNSGQQQQQNQGFNAQDIFSQFFGRQGGFNQGFGQNNFKFEFNNGGGGFHHQGFQQKQQPQKAEPLYDKTDVIELNIGNLKQLYRRNEIWFIQFYHPNNQACKNLKDEWINIANKLYGIVRIAAINCDEEEELCDEYKIKAHPSILYFPDNTALNHEVYKGEKVYQKISDFAISRMQSFVRFVNSNNFEEYKATEPDSAKILLFTEKKTTPPILKVLSKEFKGKVVFGEVRSSDSALVSQFNVKSFPAIVGISDPNVVYTGEYNRDKLEIWVRDFIYKGVFKPTYKELTKGLYQAGNCNSGDSNLCFIWFLHKDDENSIKFLKKISETYSKDSIAFYWLNKNKYPEYASSFDSSVVILRPKRKKYISLNCENYTECIPGLIELALSGGGNYKKLETLPELTGNKNDL
jgi:thioredoxin-like negative regulator of GroEL